MKRAHQKAGKWKVAGRIIACLRNLVLGCVQQKDLRAAERWASNRIAQLAPDVTHDDGARVVVETGVTCDILPGDRTPIPIGMPIRSVTEVKESGETFYFGYPAMAPNSRCRFFGPSTAIWRKSETDGLLLAILDHALARKDATFEDLVAAENYLINTDARWKTPAGRDQISGQLQFRWLQLLNRAVWIGRVP